MRMLAILSFLCFSLSVYGGILPASRGGTGANITPVGGGAVYSTSSGFAVISAGTTNQLLQSNGSSAPTWVGKLTLSAGTTVAGGAPLTIPSGSTLATPVTGAIESNGTHLWWTDSTGARHRLDQTLPY